AAAGRALGLGSPAARAPGTAALLHRLVGLDGLPARSPPRALAGISDRVGPGGARAGRLRSRLRRDLRGVALGWGARLGGTGRGVFHAGGAGDAPGGLAGRAAPLPVGVRRDPRLGPAAGL